jgi:hypothetical protein
MCSYPSGDQAFHVVVAYLHSFLSKFVEGGVHISGVSQHNRVDAESEGAELVFLTLLIPRSFSLSIYRYIALAKLPAVSVEDVLCEGVAAFGAVELGSLQKTEKIVR